MQPIASPEAPSPTLDTLSPDPRALHDSLPTFLDYAERTKLSKRTTVYRGTYYEYVCLQSLAHLGFRLRRVGGAHDGGSDLLGTWQLPSLPNPLHCVVQCKLLAKKLGPNLIRELEGSFNSAPVKWRGDDAVGVICSPMPATKGVRDAMGKSRRGIVFVMVEGMGDSEGRLRQVIWNRKIGDLGATGVDVAVRYFPAKGCKDTGEKEGEMDEEVRLSWKGKIWVAPDGGDSIVEQEKQAK